MAEPRAIEGPGPALDRPSFAITEQPRTVTRDRLFDLAGASTGHDPVTWVNGVCW